ncbi:hypothetical protein SDC9_162643 [bioreactor metagenome]|uniref:Uncharacterized protein n=1 Tax=bioreactor metagenome TaxID=1076179 RepID=A0A645FTA2_9ZZZZ
MNFHSAGGNRIEVSHISRKFFQVQFDFGCCRTGFVLSMGCYNCYHITISENLFVSDNRTFKAIGFGTGMADRQHDSVGAFDIFGSNNFDYTGHFFCFGVINAFNFGMVQTRLNDGQM